ncbi:hypothetical protein OHA25_39445 [Nonomuraea sp. NBC_00507]|uniref:hypothetical protein n=1 Tax=Nonomuraea sp. NBC_00507 TaxID=2976002 RepID=UPI002E19C3CA
MLKSYFADCIADMDRILARSGESAAERLMACWQQRRQTQSVESVRARALP